MEVPNRLQPQNIGVYPQELSETQLHTVSIAGTSADKRWVSLGLWVDVEYMEEVLLFYDLDVFGGIRSTWGKYPSKNTYTAILLLTILTAKQYHP